MQPNILLVVLDCVRASNTTLHGHYHDTTPFLSSLSEESFVYKQARAPGNWTVPSHLSMFTGFSVAELGIDSEVDYKLKQDNTVWETLTEDYGYATAVFSENPNLTQRSIGIKDIFENVVGPQDIPFPEAIDPRNYVGDRSIAYRQWAADALQSEKRIKSLLNGIPLIVRTAFGEYLPSSLLFHSTAEHYVRRFLEWAPDTDGPWAAYVNLMDAHEPYTIKDEYERWGGQTVLELYDEMDDSAWEFYGEKRPWWQREALEPLYDGAIRQMDEQLRVLIEGLADIGELENTLLIVTSDHGECFGEVSRVKDGVRLAEHGIGLHESLLHVPLIIRPPGGREETVVNDLATLQLFPSLVNSALRCDRISGEELVAESCVRVTSRVPANSLEPWASDHGADAERYAGTVTAVYEDSGDHVLKDLLWDDQTTRIKVFNAHEHRSIGTIESVKHVNPDADIGVIDHGTEMKTRPVVRNRLEDLGYL